MTLHNQITVGTAKVAGDDVNINGLVYLKAHPDNTGVIYVGKSNVTTGNGFPLSKSESVPLGISNLSSIYFVASAAGQKLAWIAQEV